MATNLVNQLRFLRLVGLRNEAVVQAVGNMARKLHTPAQTFEATPAFFKHVSTLSGST